MVIRKQKLIEEFLHGPQELKDSIVIVERRYLLTSPRLFLTLDCAPPIQDGEAAAQLPEQPSIPLLEVRFRAAAGLGRRPINPVSSQSSIRADERSSIYAKFIGLSCGAYRPGQYSANAVTFPGVNAHEKPSHISDHADKRDCYGHRRIHGGE
jgi:hypothetical protein